MADTPQRVLLLLTQQLAASGGRMPPCLHRLPLQQQAAILMKQGIFIQCQNKIIFYFDLKFFPPEGTNYNWREMNKICVTKLRTIIRTRNCITGIWFGFFRI
jgi:hypothetical protein